MTHVLPTDADNSSNRPPLDGGSNTGAGPLLGDAIHTPNSNIIEFPSGRTFLPDSQDLGPEPFILTFDVREIGALFLVVAVALIPWAFVAGVAFLYLTLVD
jgi:hypothetical protein